MTTFSRKTFDVAGYLACRPTYPQSVYDTILAYHSSTGRYDHALDLGCGPGFVAKILAPSFKRTTALDPSEKMVAAGQQPEDPKVPRIKYAVGNAEDLAGAGIGEGEEGVDLVVAAQAAHWFDHPKVWRHLTQSVRPGGTVAFVGYAEMTFPSHPSLNNLISTHSRKTLGPYWEPGRKIVDALFDPIPFPITPSTPSTASTASPRPGDLTLGKHTFHPSQIPEPPLPSSDQLPAFDPSSWDPQTAIRLKDLDGQSWLMRKTFTLATLEGYLRTWSALHAYHEQHPDEASRRGGGKDGDLVDRLMCDISAGLQEGGWKRDEVEVGWPLVLMMIKKKP